MKIEINVNEIKNETLSKLTVLEIGKLGLCQAGIYIFKGNLKSRKQYFKTVVEDFAIKFVGNYVTYEFVKLQSSGRFIEDEYAVRVYNNESKEYEEFWAVLQGAVLHGCDFFK